MKDRVQIVVVKVMFERTDCDIELDIEPLATVSTSELPPKLPQLQTAVTLEVQAGLVRAVRRVLQGVR